MGSVVSRKLGGLAARAERGQSLVEYALMVFPFFVLVMGSLDLGRAAFYHHLLTTAAQNAARTGIAAGRTSSDMCAAAVMAASTGIPGVPATTSCAAAGSSPVTAGTLSITVNRPAPATSATYASATLTYGFQPITPLISTIIGGPVTLSAQSTMYIEPE